MKFDDQGRRDYDAEDFERHCRGRSSLGVWNGITNAARGIAVLLAIGAVCGALVALSYGGHYLAGRAIGAGVRDAVAK